MTIELDQRTIDAIAYKVAIILAKKMKDQQPAEFVDTKEAAKILRITPARMRQIAYKYPHIKSGESPQSKLLFDRNALTR